MNNRKLCLKDEQPSAYFLKKDDIPVVHPDILNIGCRPYPPYYDFVKDILKIHIASRSPN